MLPLIRNNLLRRLKSASAPTVTAYVSTGAAPYAIAGIGAALEATARRAATAAAAISRQLGKYLNGHNSEL